MKHKLLDITIAVAGLAVSFCACNGGKGGADALDKDCIAVDSALERAAGFYRTGSAAEQKAVLDSLAPVVSRFENGNDGQQRVFARYLRNRLIYFAQYTNEFDSMLYYGTKAKEVAVSGNDYDQAVISLANLGDILRQRGDMVQAVAQYDEALRLNDSTIQKPEMYLAIYSGLACSYVVLRDLSLAEEYARKMEPYGESMAMVDSISYRTMLGNCYYYGKQYDKSMEQFMALDSLLRGHEELVFDRQVCNVNLADLYIQTKQSAKVGSLLDDAVRYFNDNGITAYLPYLHTLQIQQQTGLGRCGKAMALAEEYAGEIPGMNPDHRATRLLAVSQCYKACGRTEEAFAAYTAYDNLEDSLRGAQTKIVAEEMEQRYVRDAEIARHKLEQADNDLRETRLMLMVLLLVVLVAILGCYLRYRIVKARQDNERALNKILQLRNQLIHNRITPHFIANALAMGKNLTDEDIADVINLIRDGLAHDQEVMIDLDKEMELVKNYVTVALRVQSKNIQFDVNIDPDIDTAILMVPSMSVLTIIENSIKHGTPGSDGILHVEMRLKKMDKGYVLEIENDGSLGEYYRQGHSNAMYGLRLIHQTVNLVNGHNGYRKLEFDITDNNAGKVIARMKINLKTPKPHNPKTS